MRHVHARVPNNEIGIYIIVTYIQMLKVYVASHLSS